ncbi:hypothetical protein SCHPADRAFT_388012 [Schizopora paradoxa]|uniref:Uncharacterized protein n=1 Tax=Schizopora paradoxa TaxID=27342 RepID=A0A0H2RM14_9AGAM|nr:hypothetical protein SCHPADRAFT_388012 [Schizopora paradoxa]
MSDPRRHPSSSSSNRASTSSGSGSRREGASSSSASASTTPAGEAPRASSSSRPILHPPSTGAFTRTDRVSSAPTLPPPPFRQHERPPDWQQSNQQAHTSPPSHPRFDDLVDVAVTRRAAPQSPLERFGDNVPSSAFHQHRPAQRPEHGSSSNRGFRPVAYRYDSPSTSRLGPYEHSESSSSPPGRDARLPFDATSASRSLPFGRRSAQSLHSEWERQSASASASTSTHSGPPTSASSGSSGQYERRLYVGHRPSNPSTPAPPPGSTDSTATLVAYRPPEDKDDVDMEGDDGHPTGPFTGRGGALSVPYPLSNARGTADRGFGRRGGRIHSDRQGSHQTPPLEQNPAHTPPFRTPDRRASRPSDVDDDILRGYGTPSLSRNLLDSDESELQCLPFIAGS